MDEIEYLGATSTILSYNLFTYCEGNPVNRVDSSVSFWETIFDIITIAVSIVDVVSNSGDPLAQVGLAADIVDLIPFITGVGESVRAVKSVSKASNVIDDLSAGIKAIDKIEDGLDIACDSGRKIDFLVTPDGDVIPSNATLFEDNLTKMNCKNGKYYGVDSNGPVRVRVESDHIDNPNFAGPKSDAHTKPHFHIDRRDNGYTGKWNKKYTFIKEDFFC